MPRGYILGLQGGWARKIDLPKKVRIGFGRLHIKATIVQGFIVAAEQRNPNDQRKVVMRWKAER